METEEITLVEDTNTLSFGKIEATLKSATTVIAFTVVSIQLANLIGPKLKAYRAAKKAASTEETD